MGRILSKGLQMLLVIVKMDTASYTFAILLVACGLHFSVVSHSFVISS